MIMMPKARIEEQHDSMPNVSMRQYLAGHFQTILNQPLPPMEDTTQGTVKAVLNHGLWVGRCPMRDCYGEVAVTSNWPLMCCTDCGAGWFDVEFPANKDAIEAELMKRHKSRVGLPHANWDPYGGIDEDGTPNNGPETIAQLRSQRIESEGI